jgi:hypothetical protein
MNKHQFPGEPFKFYDVHLDPPNATPTRVLCGCFITNDLLEQIAPARETRFECPHGNALIVRAEPTTIICYQAKKG